jgi:hypothetical protein
MSSLADIRVKGGGAQTVTVRATRTHIKASMRDDAALANVSLSERQP